MIKDKQWEERIKVAEIPLKTWNQTFRELNAAEARIRELVYLLHKSISPEFTLLYIAENLRKKERLLDKLQGK